NEKRNLTSSEASFKDILTRIETTKKEGLQAEQETGAAAKRVAELDETLQKFARLDAAIQEQSSLKDKNSNDHQSYLQNHALGARTESPEAALKATRETELKATKDARLKTVTFDNAKRDFDPEALRRAQDAAADARAKLALDDRELENARNELKK